MKCEMCFDSVYLGASLPVHLRGRSGQTVPGTGRGFGFGSSYSGQDPSAQVRSLDSSKTSVNISDESTGFRPVLVKHLKIMCFDRFAKNGGVKVKNLTRA